MDIHEVFGRIQSALDAYTQDPEVLSDESFVGGIKQIRADLREIDQSDLTEAQDEVLDQFTSTFPVENAGLRLGGAGADGQGQDVPPPLPPVELDDERLPEEEIPVQNAEELNEADDAVPPVEAEAEVEAKVEVDVKPEDSKEVVPSEDKDGELNHLFFMVLFGLALFALAVALFLSGPSSEVKVPIEGDVVAAGMTGSEEPAGPADSDNESAESELEIDSASELKSEPKPVVKPEPKPEPKQVVKPAPKKPEQKQVVKPEPKPVQPKVVVVDDVVARRVAERRIKMWQELREDYPGVLTDDVVPEPDDILSAEEKCEENPETPGCGIDPAEARREVLGR